MGNSSKRKAVLLAVNATLLAGLSQSTVQGNTFTWLSTTDQTWTNPGNWSNNTVPGLNDAALFNTASPPSATVNIPGNLSVGAIIDNLAATSSLTINGTASVILSGQTVSIPQSGGTFSGSNVILSATSTTANGTKNLTTGSGINFLLANAQNIIVGTKGTSAVVGNSITISGNIADGGGGNAGLTLYGNGNFSAGGAALTLAGTNTFSGGLTIGSADGLNGGQVIVTANRNIGTGPIVVNDQGQLLFNTTGDYGAPGQLLTLNGTGLLNNTLSSGAIRTGGASIGWVGNVVIGASLPGDGTGGQVVLSATNGKIIEFRGTVMGSGALQKQGGGTLLFSGATNLATGTTQVSNGNITVANGSSMSNGDLIIQQSSSNTGVALNLYNTLQTVGNLSSGFTSTSNNAQFINLGTFGGNVGGQLNIKQTVNTAFGYGAVTSLTSTIQGAGSLSLDAASTGRLTLTGPNAYQGGTVINGGTLNLANGTGGSATGTGNVIVNNGGALATGQVSVAGLPVSAGQMSGTLVVNTGGSVYPGGGNAAGTLSVGGLIANGGSAFNFDLVGGRHATADFIHSGGTLTLDGSGPETINIHGSQLAFGTYPLMDFSGLTGGTGSFTLGTTPGGSNRTYAISTGATGVTLVVTNTGVERDWSIGGQSPPNDGAGTWSAGGTNFFNTPSTSSAPYDNAATSDLVVGNGGSGATITLGSDVRVGGALILGDVSAPYIIGAAGGAHTLQLAKGIAASANATINAPVILEGSQTFSVDATHTLLINNNLSQTGGSAATLTKDDVGTIVLAGTGTYTGGTVVNAGTLQGTTSAFPAAGGINNSANLVFSQATAGTYSGTISGAGTVTIAGTAAVALGGSNLYTGPTVLQAGTLALSSAGGIGAATILMSGGTLRTDADVTLPITNKAMSLVAGTTTTVNTNGHTLTLNEILNGGGNLTKTGAGTLVITGIHTTDVIGELAINAGTVSIAPPSTVSYGFNVSSQTNAYAGDLLLSTAFDVRIFGTGTIGGGGTIRVVPSGMQIESRGTPTIANNIVLNDAASPAFSVNIDANASNSLTITGRHHRPKRCRFHWRRRRRAAWWTQYLYRRHNDRSRPGWHCRASDRQHAPGRHGCPCHQFRHAQSQRSQPDHLVIGGNIQHCDRHR